MGQAFGDGEGAEVNVRTGDLVTNLSQRCIRVHVAELFAGCEESVQLLQHIIALDNGDLHALDPMLRSDFEERVFAGVWVHTARVCDHLDVLLDDARQDAIYESHTNPLRSPPPGFASGASA